VTVRDKEGGGWTTKTIVKEGPTGLVFTTTKAQVHRENETRVLSVTSDDSRAQTARVFRALADENNGAQVQPWLDLQSWLRTAEHRVTIPYAVALAALVPPIAVRLRRDFGAVLSLIRAHAVLHQLSRGRADDGRIVASYDDYQVVAGLVAPLIAEGVGATVSHATRETVEAVAALVAVYPKGVSAQAVAVHLSLDKSNVSRRLSVAGSAGWLVNQEDRRGRPGRWLMGERLPDEQRLLPTVARLRAVAEGRATADKDEPAGQRADDPSGCAVARSPDRYRDDLFEEEF
jgi:hypothetical protein